MEESYVGGADMREILSEFENFETTLQPEELKYFHLMLYDVYRRHFDYLHTYGNLISMLTKTKTLHSELKGDYKVKYGIGEDSEKLFVAMGNGLQMPYRDKYFYSLNECEKKLIFGNGDRCISCDLEDFEDEDGVIDLTMAMITISGKFRKEEDRV